MPKTGPIILIEDDEDDQQLFRTALKDLKVTRPLYVFSSAAETLSFLRSMNVKPFIIFCDINMPYMTGFELKKLIDQDRVLKAKSIPFLFYSTNANELHLQHAYLDLTTQGYFQKPSSYREKLGMLKDIIEYWETCKSPGG